mmetsp:Transcript_56036/g.103697  ORF Transcript_56036/g.103697 Transcript_56036/m.103697 type:complete len:309 (+) Transcript_56036:77-1003(+)
MDAIKEVAGVLLKFKAACDAAKTNKETSEELLSFARLVEAEICTNRHRDTHVRKAVSAVTKACATVERVTQRGGNSTIDRVRGACSDRWNAAQDQKDLVDCATELNQVLILMGHGLEVEILNELHAIAERDASASQRILDRLADMDARSEARHGEAMEGIGQLQRSMEELLKRDPPAAAVAPRMEARGGDVVPKLYASVGNDCKDDDVRDKRYGKGTFTFPNGEAYIGQWQDGLQHGQGKATTVGGKKGVTYEGEYMRGKRHGRGTLTLLNGETYSGQWQDGLRHGQGTSTYKDLKKSGRFEFGKFMG